MKAGEHHLLRTRRLAFPCLTRLVACGILGASIYACGDTNDDGTEDAGSADLGSDSGATGDTGSRATVLPGAGPVITTLSWGHLHDLSISPCTQFEFSATDADSESLTFTVEGLPEGAELIQDGSTATVSWCPTPQQIDERANYRLMFEVSDGTYSVWRPHTLWLMPPHGFPCPADTGGIEFGFDDGPLPVAWGWAARYRTSSSQTIGYPEDGMLTLIKQGTREDPPDFATWTILPPLLDASTPSGPGRAVGWILPDMLDGPAPTLNFAAIAEVNADPLGSTCDQTIIEVQTRETAFGYDELELPIVGCGTPCASSEQCASGVCLQTEHGPLCDSSGLTDLCPERGTRVTVEGTPVDVCLPFLTVCRGGESRELPRGCDNDGFEPNDDAASATPVEVGVSEEATLCMGEVDVYSIALDAGQTITVGVQRRANPWQESYNETILRVRDAAGNVLARSDNGFLTLASDQNPQRTAWFNAVEARVAEAQTITIEVLGKTERDRDHYALEIDVRDEPCEEDAAEPNDSAAAPTLVSSGEDFAGTICRSNEDWLAIDVETPGLLDVILAFDFEATDLDVELFAPDGTRIGALLAKRLDEEGRFEVSEAGRYLIRIRGWGFTGCIEDSCTDVVDTEPAGRYTARITAQ